MHSIINPRYLDLQEFLTSLPDTFDSLASDRVLRSGRNEVRQFTVGNRIIVVKSFRKFSALNRVVYGTIRRSKAERAYYHALRLRELGIGTPEPIAVIDVRRHGLMVQSFYVYAYSDYAEIQELLNSIPTRGLSRC